MLSPDYAGPAHCSQLLSDTYERNTGGGGEREHGGISGEKRGGHKSRWEEK